MLINESNIAESFRLFACIEKEATVGIGENMEYIKSGESYVIAKLKMLTDLLTLLEMNDRYTKNDGIINTATPKQIAFAVNLAKKDPEGAKIILGIFNKTDIDKLTKDEISQFISKMSGRD